MRVSYFVRRVARTTAWLVGLLLALAVPASAQPTVNGLFHGDGDNALYQPYSVSEYGSVLYSYLDVSTLTLYVALVVDHSVNDMVCSPNKPYTSSVGWNPPRDCKRASDSEYAEFSLECAPGSPNSWTWQQGMGCPTNNTVPVSDWVSNSTCGSSSVAGDWPPGVETTSSTSWVANVNTYQDATTARGWDLYANGTALTNWKSPFLSSAPDDATLVPGYPTYSGSNYEWEWSMIYEWSVNLGAGGADCGSEAIFFVTGQSHHSPSKNGDENDDFPPPSNPRLSDWGDNPASYGTTASAGGAQHYIKVSGPYLGSQLQAESDGTPTNDATGDGDEEDGVSAVVDGDWTAGSTQQLEVVVGNAPSGAVLAGWFDWNEDGDFQDAGEYFTWNVSDGTNTLNLTVGAGFDWQTDDLYTRFRIFSSAAAAPGGSLSPADSVGIATDGEVEDHRFEAGSLPVTLNAFASEMTGGGLTVRWQTASETDNVAFEVWGLVHGAWQPISDLISSREMSSGLPQTYEVRLDAPAGLAALELVDYDSRGGEGRFGAFRLDARHGEFQPTHRIDWSGPRAERRRRLAERGFGDTRTRAGEVAGGGGDGPLHVRAAAEAVPGASRWKKLHRGAPVRGAEATSGSVGVAVAAGRGGNGKGQGTGGATGSDQVSLVAAPRVHVAVTEAGVQRVTYEALRDGGLDLAGVHRRDVAVTFRGEPVARWISGGAKLGPGSTLEFVGAPPTGDDALHLDAYLYQVSADRAQALDAATLGRGRVRDASIAYPAVARSDRPLLYRHQSPTGDPWVERSVFARGGRDTDVILELEVSGEVADDPGVLEVGLGTLSDLPDQRDASGAVLDEHHVEVAFRGPGGDFLPLASASTADHTDWRIEAIVPAGWITPGTHQVRLRFTTPYFYSLVVVDDYALRYHTPYRGPSLAFPADRGASGYRIEGFDSSEVVAYATGADGSLTRLEPRMVADAEGWTAELRDADAARIWVTEAPHEPAVFTTEASPDLLAGPADLVILTGSSFVGTRALDDYVAQHADMDPVVVDVEDVYNAVGHGMALPSALTDYLAARDAVHPFSHVQLVGADCYDRHSYISDCVSFLPLPTAKVGMSVYTPSQNRLVDLDGDGVGDKAVGQFSVRDEAELATIVAKADDWHASGLAGAGSALLIAEEPDGVHSFSGQIDRLGARLGWADSEILDLADHPQIQTARDAMGASLDAGRALTVFSGHSSPTVWSFRGLLTTGNAPSVLGNHGRPTVMVPLACETTYDISPDANVLGHQLLFAGEEGALAISGAVALSSLQENERMAEQVLAGLDAGRSLGEAVLGGRRALGDGYQELQDNWITQGDVALRMER